MNFGELIQKFKEDESAESIVPLIEDESLRNGIVAWKSVSIKYKELIDCEHKDEVAQWNWLWNRIEYMPDDFGIVAGVKAQESGTLLKRLIGLRLIYPDGTIHNFAQQYLKSIIMNKIGGRRSKRKEEEKEEEKEKEE